MKYLTALLSWVDHRTGLNKAVHEALYERIPSGARWRYVFGSMLVFAFVTQAMTGVFLGMGYSPSSQTAYESVFYIQHEMTGGWLVRGLHHFMAQAMVVLLGLHLLQVVWDGAYKKPREVNYWLGLILMQIVLGLGLTGYLLPWDQKGYWATNVATNLMTLVPVVGKDLQQIVLGGGEYGHHTLTRFYVLHAGVLPALLIAFLGMHIAVFRRHGITAKITPNKPDQFFWPHQVLFDGIACLVLLAVVMLCVVHCDVGGVFSGRLPAASRGAELGAPADAAAPYSAARPEWYFLFLFQLLKYFKSEFVGAIALPGLFMTVLFLLPIWGSSTRGHRFNVGFLLTLMAGAGLLTYLALSEDGKNKGFQEAKQEANHDAERVVELYYRHGDKSSEPLKMPREGAVYLFRNDPLAQGPKLFVRHCGSCHDFATADGKRPVTVTPQPSAPNLFGFASRDWLRGLLDGDRITSPAYFGNTAHKDGRMAAWVESHFKIEAGSEKDKEKQELRDAVVVALSAQARLHSQQEIDGRDTEQIARGVQVIQQTCTNGCHRFGDRGQLGLAPDLTGYGSYEWLMGFVSHPSHERFYGRENDRMPAFAEDVHSPEKNVATPREIGLIVDWLRGDFFTAHDKSPVLPHTEEQARRAVELARLTKPSPPATIGSPKTPETPEQRAKGLFAQNCSACHSHADANGKGIVATAPSAPNLFSFASRAWLTGLLDPQRVNGDDYFGRTKHFEGDMAGFVTNDLVDLKDEQKTKLNDIIAAISAEAALPSQTDADKTAASDGTIARGKKQLTQAIVNTACSDCHKFSDADSGDAPTLIGYGSLDWLKRMISNPNHADFYGKKNDRMPAFARGENDAPRNLLTSEELDLLARWLRGETLDK